MISIASTVFVTAALFTVPAVGQIEKGEAALVYAEKQGANTTSLARYFWVEKIEFSEEGMTRLVKMDKVKVGPDGKMQKVEVSRESSLKEKKRKTEKAREMWQEIVGLVQSYTHRTPGELVDFFQAAVIRDGIGLMEGTMKVTGADIIKEEDGLRIWVDRETHLPVRMEIHTWIVEEKNYRWMVDGTIEFKTLPDGTAYPARSIVELPVQSMQLTIETSDHTLEGW